MNKLHSLIIAVLLLIPVLAFGDVTILNLADGEVRSGVFEIRGGLGDPGAAADVRVRINDGPWEPAVGTSSWSYEVDYRSFVVDQRYVFNPVAGRGDRVYTRGVFYGTALLEVAAFDSDGFMTESAGRLLTIIPEAPVVVTEPGTYNADIELLLETYPELTIYYVTGDGDPAVSGTAYDPSSPPVFSTSTVVRAVAMDGSGEASEVIELDYQIDTTAPPRFFVQYFADPARTESLGINPYLSEGPYYLEVFASKALSEAPVVTIDAEGSLNDVLNGTTTAVGTDSRTYWMERTIVADADAIGAIPETITVTGTDTDTPPQTVTDALPENGAEAAAYTDTTAPDTGTIAVDATTNDSTPVFSITSDGADLMQIALSETALATADWIPFSPAYDELDISAGGAGSRTVWARFKDFAGNESASAINTGSFTFDNSTVAYDMQYFADPEFTVSLGDNPYFAVGTYYLRVTPNKDLASAPSITIDAEGTANDVIDQTLVERLGVYRLTRTITDDAAAAGIESEQITINGIPPTNESSKRAYTDTQVPNVYAGTDVDWTSSAVDLSAQVFDLNPLKTYLWEKVAGDGELIFGNPTAAQTTAAGLPGQEAEFVIRFVAEDAAGNAASDLLTFAWDAKAPEVDLISPSDGDEISGTAVPVEVFAEDIAGVASVELFVDGVSVETDTASPFVFNLDTTAFDDGLHDLKVVAIDNRGNSSTDDDTAVSTENFAPANVTDLTFAAGDGEIAFSWTNPTDSDFVETVLVRNSASPTGPTDGSEVYRGTGTSFTDDNDGAGLTNGVTYFYGVYTFDESGNASNGQIVSAVPRDNRAPDDIAAFTATDQAGAVELTWTNPADSDFAKVKILRKTTGYSAHPFDGLAVYEWTGEVYTDESVADDGTAYYYTAFTYDEVPNFSHGVGVVIAPGSGDTTAPAPVTGLTATGGDGEVVLSWTNPTDTDLAGIKLVRNDAATPVDPTDGVLLQDSTGTGYTDTDVVNGETYYYAAFAYDTSSNTAAAATASATPQAVVDTTPPGPVTSVAATAGDESVDLGWTNPTEGDFAGTLVVTSESAITWTPAAGTGYTAGEVVTTGVTVLGVPGSTDSGITDSGLTNGTTYHYALFAFDTSDNYASGASADATPADTTPPEPVSAFSAEATASSVSLSWGNPVDDFSGVAIVRKEGGFPTAVDDAGATVVYRGTDTSYVDESVSADITYYYRAYAFDEVPNYADPAGAFATPGATDTIPPADVGSFAATAADGAIDLGWTNPTDSDYQGVKIQRLTTGYPSGPSDGVTVSEVETPGESFSDTSVDYGTTYYYKAFAYDAVGNFSAGVEATSSPLDLTAPAAVGSFSASAGDATVSLSWTLPAADDLAGVVVVRAEGTAPTAHDQAGVTEVYTGTGTSATDENVTNDLVYGYAAFAYDAAGNYSTAAAATATPTDTTAPGPVTNLSGSAGDATAAISWSNPTDSDFAGTLVVRSDSAITWTPAAGSQYTVDVETPVDTGVYVVLIGTDTDTAFSEGALTNFQDYHYAVFAFDGKYNYSAAATVSVFPADTVAPDDVTDFALVAGEGEIALSWVNPSDDFTGVLIVRSPDAEPASIYDGEVIYEDNGQSYLDNDGGTGLTNGTTYFYRIFSYDEVDNYSTGITASAVPGDTVPPEAVTVFEVTPGDQENDISWSAPTDTTDLAGYLLVTGSGDPITWEPTTGVTYAVGEIVDATEGVSVLALGGSLGYTHAGLTNGASYSYAVFSYDEVPNYAAGATGSGVPADTVPPDGVSGFVAVPNSTTADLSWTNPTEDFSGVVIVISESAITWTPTTDQNYGDGDTVATGVTVIYNNSGTSDTVSSLTLNSTYYFAAFAYDAVGNYSAGASTAVTITNDTTPPGPTTGATATPGEQQVSLSWTNPGDVDFAGVRIVRKIGVDPTGPGDGTVVYDGDGTEPTKTTHLDTGMAGYQSYHYAIYAKDENGNYATTAATATAEPWSSNWDELKWDDTNAVWK